MTVGRAASVRAHHLRWLLGSSEFGVDCIKRDSMSCQRRILFETNKPGEALIKVTRYSQCLREKIKAAVLAPPISLKVVEVNPQHAIVSARALIIYPISARFIAPLPNAEQFGP